MQASQRKILRPDGIRELTLSVHNRYPAQKALLPGGMTDKDENSVLEGAGSEGPPDAEPRERRRHARVHIDMPGRLFVPAEEREIPCTVFDISPAGARLQGGIELAPETPVVLYIDSLGRFDGNVVWENDGRTGIRFASGPLKQERTAEALARIASDGCDGASARRHGRVGTNTASHFVRADGSIAPCVILNLSTGGALIKADIRPAIGEYILIGKMAGRVVRYHEEGLGIEFVR